VVGIASWYERARRRLLCGSFCVLAACGGGSSSSSTGGAAGAGAAGAGGGTMVMPVPEAPSMAPGIKYLVVVI
jgi:hypothetical protein